MTALTTRSRKGWILAPLLFFAVLPANAQIVVDTPGDWPADACDDPRPPCRGNGNHIDGDVGDLPGPDGRVSLREAIIAANEDAEVGAIVITGAGRAFCAGADISGWQRDLQQGAGPAARADNHVTRAGDSWIHLLQRSKPVIASAPGRRGLMRSLACAASAAAMMCRGV